MSITKTDLIKALKLHAARHYSYRDFHMVATGATPATYTFGTNARAISIFNWPNVGDYPTALTCYAREVKVLCTEDCWIRFLSVNPRYTAFLAMGYTVDQIAALGVPATITEIAQFILRNDDVTFYPTYGIAIVFYQSTASGTIYIWVEGSTERGK